MQIDNILMKLEVPHHLRTELEFQSNTQTPKKTLQLSTEDHSRHLISSSKINQLFPLKDQSQSSPRLTESKGKRRYSPKEIS
jgi:hypothetical protein